MQSLASITTNRKHAQAMRSQNMTNMVSMLSADESRSLFGIDAYHIQLSLKRIPDARILWINHSMAISDPMYKATEGDHSSYEAHILANCAFAISEGEVEQNDDANCVIGFADRYGGAGIGANGGSGRAAVVNGYLVKGIGRTPLVSIMTEPSHASGGAYLEESIRETIYSEIVRAEFPHSAVPVLAIIDTGRVQQWDLGNGKVKFERRVLLVRPCFVRPAHFIRAVGFISKNPKEGSLDHFRVKSTFQNAVAIFGKDGMANSYRNLWTNWAEQMAYAFIHRMQHGSNTLSNISFSGALLDFGAMSAIPSWANAATMYGWQPFMSGINSIKNMVRSTAYYFSRHVDEQLFSSDRIEAIVSEVHAKFSDTVLIEFLYLCGVRRETSENILKRDIRKELLREAVSIIIRFQKEQFDMFVATPTPRIPWDIDRMWNVEAPTHMQRMKSLIESILPQGEYDLAPRRCRFVAATRSDLFREEMKSEIYGELDQSSIMLPPDRKKIESFINRRVAGGRRDHRMSLSNARQVGFGVGTRETYVVFQDNHSKTLFAVRERPRSLGAQVHTAEQNDVLAIEDYSNDRLIFTCKSKGIFSGCVVMCKELK